MKKHLLFVGLFSALIVPSFAAHAEVVDKVVAVVGNEIITLSDVNKFKAERGELKKSKGHLSIGGPAVSLDKDPLQALIDEKIIHQEIDRLALNATPEDINGAIQEVLQRNKATLEALKGELAGKGTSFESYKKQLGEQIRQMKFMGQVIYPRIKISEQELAKKAPNSSDEARFQARVKILEEQAPAEVEKYLAEVRSKTLIEIK